MKALMSVIAMLSMSVAESAWSAAVVYSNAQTSYPNAVGTFQIAVSVPVPCTDCILVASIGFFGNKARFVESADYDGVALTFGPDAFSQQDNVRTRSYTAWLRSPVTGSGVLTLVSSNQGQDLGHWSVVVSVVSGLADQEPIFYGAADDKDNVTLGVQMSPQAGSFLIDSFAMRTGSAADAVSSPIRTELGVAESPTRVILHQSTMTSSGSDFMAWNSLVGPRAKALTAVAFLPTNVQMMCPFSWTPTEEILLDLPRVVDVTDPQFGAQCDGVSDDTASIQAALDYSDAADTFSHTVKLPDGECVVSDTLRVPVYHRLKGNGKEETALLLTPGTFPASSPGDVIATRSLTPVGNDAFRNYVEDLTIRVGPGNEGATGVDLLVSNVGGMSNVDVTFEDGAGRAGIASLRQYPGSGLVKNVSVSGGDYGWEVAEDIYSMQGAFLEFTDQNVAALSVAENTVLVESMSVSGAPIATFASGKALVNVLDSAFTNGNPASVAMQGSGSYFLRRVSCFGYAGILAADGEQCAFEAVTSPVLMAWPGSSPVSIDLPWVEPPAAFTSDNPAHWVSIREFGGVPGVEEPADLPDGTAFLNAMHSMRPFVALDGSYLLPDEYRIPRWTHTIDGMNGAAETLGGTTFVVEEESETPLTLRNWNVVHSDVVLHLRAPRPVVLRNMVAHGKILMDPGSGPLWLENVLLGELIVGPENVVYARQLNMEEIGNPPKPALVQNSGGRVAIRGFKHESRVTLARTTNGGCTEILGVSAYMVSPTSTPPPMFIVEDAAMTASYNETAYTPDRAFQTILVETRNGVTQTLEKADVPQRGLGSQGVLVSAWDGAGCSG